MDCSDIGGIISLSSVSESLPPNPTTVPAFSKICSSNFSIMYSAIFSLDDIFVSQIIRPQTCADEICVL